MTAIRTSVVTGGSSGIGLAIAHALRAAGDDVVIIGRDQHRLDTAAADLGATPIAADVSDLRAVTQVAAAVDRVDVLVNCAGFGLTYSQARGLAPRGITVNAVAPGFIEDTGFTGTWPQDRIDSIVAQTPVGRPGTGADVAAACVYLASPAASFVTGQVRHVNGGWAFR